MFSGSHRRSAYSTTCKYKQNKLIFVNAFSLLTHFTEVQSFLKKGATSGVVAFGEIYDSLSVTISNFLVLPVNSAKVF